MLMRCVHIIASQYHWTEADILRLPETRRMEYVRMIIKEHEKGSGRQSWE
jgi:hypothetical protein